ncbi:MAG: sugar phosphorylase [Trueperaceae bacterium]
MTLKRSSEILEHLTFIYPHNATPIYESIKVLLEGIHLPPKQNTNVSSERDVVVIIYGDQISTEGETPLKTLHGFANKYLNKAVTGIHLLPFYPYTSDDGFSVVDYLVVDKNLGDWADVEAMSRNYKLMFDAVINHVSAKSEWFQSFLRDEAPYTDYFITENPGTDLSKVVRPRTSPLLTPFETPSGTKHVWTTFSADQIDINYENPKVLLEVIKMLLLYIEKGAEIIRLDAVTYLWKEVGTTCVHHPKTHRVLQLFRSIVEDVAPHVVLLTETNVPHEENMSYFGDGHNEARMVYNFALPPLTLYTFLKQDATALQSWVTSLKTPGDKTCFFNFLASHDGIGVRPIESILGKAGIDFLVESVQQHGGFISYKNNSDGSQSPYEMNIVYFDALNNPNVSESVEMQVKRFIAAHSIMFALAGMPGIYIHSLLGSRSYHDGVKQTGHNRSINREKFDLDGLEADLTDAQGLRRQVLDELTKLLEVRQCEKAFHPQTSQEVLTTQKEVFALRRGDAVYCLHNVSTQAQEVALPVVTVNMLTGEPEVKSVRLEPLGVKWLKRVS